MWTLHRYCTDRVSIIIDPQQPTDLPMDHGSAEAMSTPGMGNPRPARFSDPARGLRLKLYAIRPGKVFCDQVYGPNINIHKVECMFIIENYLYLLK